MRIGIQKSHSGLPLFDRWNHQCPNPHWLKNRSFGFKLWPLFVFIGFEAGSKGIDLFDCGYFLCLPEHASARKNRGWRRKLYEQIGLATGAIPNRWRKCDGGK